MEREVRFQRAWVVVREIWIDAMLIWIHGLKMAAVVLLRECWHDVDRCGRARHAGRHLLHEGATKRRLRWSGAEGRRGALDRSAVEHRRGVLRRSAVLHNARSRNLLCRPPGADGCNGCYCGQHHKSSDTCGP